MVRDRGVNARPVLIGVVQLLSDFREFVEQISVRHFGASFVGEPHTTALLALDYPVVRWERFRPVAATLHTPDGRQPLSTQDTLTRARVMVISHIHVTRPPSDPEPLALRGVRGRGRSNVDEEET